MIQTCQMKPANENVAPRRPQQPTQRPQTEIPSSSVFGFPMSENKFQFLQESTSAVSQSSIQIEDKLIDPRSTRLSRSQAARRFEDQETFAKEGIFHIVPQVQDVQGILISGDFDQSVTSRIRSQFFPNSLSVSAPDILK